MTTHFDDTYTGPRFTYGLTYRPIGGANVPDGFIIFSDRTHPNFKFGTIDYPQELAPEKAAGYELTPVKQAN